MTANRQAQENQVCFSSEVFDLEAVKRAAYRVSNEFAVDIDLDGNRIICTLHPSKRDADIGNLVNRFRSEVLDYDLRIRIAKETEPFRNLILSIAFSKTGLQE